MTLAQERKDVNRPKAGGAARAALFLAALFSVEAARACSVCFGGANSDMVRGFYWGVILLGSLPFALMALLFGLIVYHTKKNKPVPSPR